MKSDPIRLLDDAGTASAIRTVLEAGRDTHPVAYDEEAATARFRALLAGGAVTGAVAVGVAGSISGAQGLRGLLGKAAVKVGLAVVIPVAGVYAVATSEPAVAPPAGRAVSHVALDPALPDPPAVAPAPAGSVRQGSSLPSVRALESLPLDETPSREGQPARAKPRLGPTSPPAVHGEAPGAPRSEPPASLHAGATEPARPREEELRARAEEEPAASAQKQSAKEAPVVDGRSAAAEEMRAVVEARALQRTNPGQALEILSRLQEKYPRGYFQEERRAIAVTALFVSGSTARARKQGASFLDAYPNGPFTDEIRRLMDR